MTILLKFNYSTNMMKKKVTFSDKDTYFLVPDREDSRVGTWKIDADRFRMRVLAFEKKFVLFVKNEKVG